MRFVCFQLLERIIAIARLEARQRREQKMADTTQAGQYINFRNMTLNRVEYSVAGLLEHGPPASGLLEFDYVSTRRPPEGATALDAESFTTLLQRFRSELYNEQLWCIDPFRCVRAADRFALVSVAFDCLFSPRA